MPIHKDKVQSVQWNDKDPTVLLTGSYDRTVRVFDSRAPDAGVGATLGADVEALRWDPWESHSFYVSTTCYIFYFSLTSCALQGLARKWPCVELRRANVADERQPGNPGAFHAAGARWRGVITRRQPAHSWMYRNGRHGQGGQDLEHYGRRGLEQASSQPGDFEGSRSGT